MTADDHGSASTYSNHKCRCPRCSAAWSRSTRRRRQVRRDERILVGTRWVATADVKHGSASTYDNWGCQCFDCTEAHKLRARRWRARRRERERASS